MALALLVGCLGALWWFVKGDVAEYARFKALSDSRSRQRRYRLWIVKAALLFVLPTLIALGALRDWGALTAMPDDFATARAALPAIGLGGDLSGFFGGMLIGAMIGGALLGGFWAVRRKRHDKKPVMLGEVGSLLPRNRAELWHAAALSVSAGVSEELFFRLTLPLLIARVTGDALVGFAAAAILFGLAHLYQKWVGILATGLLGVLFSILYLASGSLILAILVHIVIDLNGLVLRPWMSGVGRGAPIPSAATRS